MLLLLLLLLMLSLLLLQSYLLRLQQAVVPAFKLFFLVVNTTGMGLESHFLKVASHHRRKRKLPCEPALFPCRRLIWSDYDKHKETCTIPLFHKTEIERRDPQAFHPPIEKKWDLTFVLLFILSFVCVWWESITCCMLKNFLTPCITAVSTTNTKLDKLEPHLWVVPFFFLASLFHDSSRAERPTTQLYSIIIMLEL